MGNLTANVKAELDAAQTDSDVRDVAERNGADVEACADYKARSMAKGKCITCRNVGLYPSMYPCNACAETQTSVVNHYEVV